MLVPFPCRKISVFSDRKTGEFFRPSASCALSLRVLKAVNFLY